jgi:hypothetical protein
MEASMSSARGRLPNLVIVAAAALAAVAMAAGCRGSHAAPVSRSSVNLAAAWHRVVVCARAHGMPGLQDPRIDSTGKAIFPHGLNIPPETRQACQRLVDQLVPSTQEHSPTSAQMAGLMRFARCMRSHGISDWPDPRPDGSFVPDARIANSLKSAFLGQLRACEHFNPDPHGRAYFSQP